MANVATIRVMTKTESIQAAIVAALRGRKAGLTNAELSDELRLPYRTVQRNAHALWLAGILTGTLVPAGVRPSTRWRLTNVEATK